MSSALSDGFDRHVAWHHAALCRLALPLRPPAPQGWSRDAGGAVVQIEPLPALRAEAPPVRANAPDLLAGEPPSGAAPEPAALDTAADAPPLPAGRGLRLVLIHLFSAALASGTSQVELGAGPEAIAERFGLEASEQRLRELREAADRLLSARLRLVEGLPPGLAMLDARAKVKLDAQGWRPSLRLNERFFGHLQKQAVPLDARAVGRLAGSVPALDAYVWLAATLPGVADGQPALHGWEALYERFADGGPLPARFQEAFSASLSAARDAYPDASFTIGEEGVELQRSPSPVPGLMPPPEPRPRPRRLRAEAAAAPPVLPAAATAGATRPGGEAPGRVAEYARPDDGAAGDVAPDGPDSGAPQEGDGDAPPPARRDAEVPGPDTAVDGTADAAPREPLGVDTPAERGGGRARRATPAAGGASRERSEPGGRREARQDGRLSLPPTLTGLPMTVWLRRGERGELMAIEVTPGTEFDLRRRAVLAVEPILLQVSGQLHPRELDRVAAWAVMNADLIQDVWDGSLPGGPAALQQVRGLPSSRW